MIMSIRKALEARHYKEWLVQRARKEWCIKYKMWKIILNLLVRL